MADEEERLVVLLEARIKDLERNMARASGVTERRFREMSLQSKRATKQMEEDAARSTARINQSVATVGTKIGDFGKAFAGNMFAGVTLSVAGFTAAVKTAIQSTAELSRQSRMAGVDVEAFQELKFVAEQNRIGIDVLTDGLKEMNLRADEFIATGAGGGAEAFQRLGYSSEELARKIQKPSDLFVEIIGRMQQFERAAQIRIGDEVFGGSAGERFVELVDQGADGLREHIRLAREMGLVMNEQMVKQAEEVDKKFNILAATIGTTLKRSIVEAVQGWMTFFDSWRAFENQATDNVQRALISTYKEIEAAKQQLEDLATDKVAFPGDINIDLNIDKQNERLTELTDKALKLRGILDGRQGLDPKAPATPAAPAFTPKDTSADYMRAYRDELAKTNRERQVAAETERILADAASKGASLTRQQAAALAEESVARNERNAAASKSTTESDRSAQATEKERERIAELIKDLETEIALVWASDEAKRAAAASRQAGAAATEKEREKIVALNEALFQEEEARRKGEETLLYYRDLTRAGLDDLFNAVEQGKDFWSAMGDVGVNSLKRIADTMLNDVLDSIFQVNSAASGAGGGFFSSLLGGLGGLFGGGSGIGKGTSSTSAWATGINAYNAKGGVYGASIPFAKGGAFTNSIVDRPTLFPFAKGTGLMGEAGPEAIMPLSRDASGRLGVAVAGGGDGGAQAAANVNLSYAPVYNVRGYGEDIIALKRQIMANDHAFSARVVNTIREARDRGVRI